MSVSIASCTSGPAATNSFLLWDDQKTGVIFDAPPGSFDELEAVIEKEVIEPHALILTHTHWDHTVDTNRFREKYGDTLKVYVHRDDEYRISDPMKHLMWDIPIEMDPTKPDEYLADGQTLEIGEFRFEVMHAPGHSEGSVCLYDREHGFVVVGDVLFAGSVGRTDLPGGDWDTLMESIQQKLLRLPDETRVYPGHGPVTTIGSERESNPFVIG